MIAQGGGRRKLTPAEREQKRVQRLADEKVARDIARRIEGWKVVATYDSSSSDAVHTVERNGQEYRCTCQGFRIFKRGYCKHTDRTKARGL